ncbi:MAG: EAL domain-containing protein, partial [Anaerolineae bacterium]|nr:EAL domain-containing protein [Anaerolineae bacterium]
AIISSATFAVVVTAWRYGLKGGIYSGVIAWPINLGLLTLTVESGLNQSMQRGIPGSIGLIAVGGVVGKMRDLMRRLEEALEEREAAEKALRASEERYALAIQGVNDGLWDWDLQTDSIYFSPRWKTMLGYHPDDVFETAEAWFDLVHSDDIEALKTAIEQCRQIAMVNLDIEYRALNKDGSYRWMLARGQTVLDEHGAAYRMAGSQADITERKVAEEKIRHDALHDNLTDLPNRAYIMAQLVKAIDKYQEDESKLFAILFIDIDRFKVINDTLGHYVGDTFLIEVAGQIKNCLRPQDVVARLGGDEFVVLLEGIGNIGDATVVADRINEKLEHPLELSGNKIFTAASIGIVCCSPEYEKPEEYLRDADIAMYRAKAGGRARFEVFDQQMRTSVLNRQKMELDLREAILHNQFQMYYQPITDLDTNQIEGFEALLRWQHPTRGLILPQEIIPLAEETGLMGSIGEWIIQEACRQLQEWQRRFPADPPLSISINLSRQQIKQVDLDEVIGRCLRDYNLNAVNVRLEVAERDFVLDTNSVVMMLQRLKALGVSMHMDDFGTGNSALNFMKDHPVDMIKIDRAITSGLDADKIPGLAMKTIMLMAQELNIKVIAEGIETSEQLQQIKSLGCEYGQGYYFSKPLDRHDAETLLIKHNSN